VQIAIPSYRRSHTVFEKTISALVRSGVPLDNVTVFISDPEEHDAYVSGTGNMVKVVDSVPTLAGNRNFILDYYPQGEKILFLDDDIVSFEKLSTDGKRLIPDTNVLAFAEKGFDWCEKQGKSLWGIYAARNYFFMDNDVTEGLHYIIGSCYGIINRKKSFQRVEFDEKEDYLRTLKHFDKEKGVVRLNYITVNTAYYKEQGGMQETRTNERVERYAKILAQEYPDYCKAYVSKGKGTWELRLATSTYKKKLLETI
tara:strand:- start:251 stop:1018 length:768 start_codon:yes stop_codon:yes gene_type:complete